MDRATQFICDGRHIALPGSVLCSHCTVVPGGACSFLNLGPLNGRPYFFVNRIRHECEEPLVEGMALVCPICKSPAAELRHTGDATGFYCTIHGHFKIANTVALDDYYTRAEWEVALRAAKHKAMEGEWPVIWPWDFFRERES
jgi:hypothetical protein